MTFLNSSNRNIVAFLEIFYCFKATKLTYCPLSRSAGCTCIHPQHSIPHHLLYRRIERGGRAMPKVEQQHHPADRPSIQHIFYGLLFYTGKFFEFSHCLFTSF